MHKCLILMLPNYLSTCLWYTKKHVQQLMKTFQYSISFNLTLSEYLALSPSPRSEPVGRWRKTKRDRSRAEVVTIDSISSIEESHKTWSSCVQSIRNIIILYVSNDSHLKFFSSFFYDSIFSFTIKCKKWGIIILAILFQIHYHFWYNQNRIECSNQFRDNVNSDFNK